MNLFKNIFGKKREPEDLYNVAVKDDSVTVRHPAKETQSIQWKDIVMIKLINTDEGPAKPDVWLALIGENNQCVIPQGCKDFEEVYEIVSRFDGFDFESFINSMSTADNAEFLLWIKK